MAASRRLPTDGKKRRCEKLQSRRGTTWVCRGIRSHRDDVQPLVPGVPVRVQLELFPVSYVFKSGHRIRVSVTGADYRERDRQAVDPAPNLKIFDSVSNPSTIALPIRGG